MSIMGNVAGLGAIPSDWAQTDETKADYIRNKPDIPALEQTLRKELQRALAKSGGTMEGVLSMGGNALRDLPAPGADGDAVNRGYLLKQLGAGLLRLELTLPAAAWTGNGPYTQSVAAEEIVASDRPHFGAVYGGSTQGRLAQREDFALVDDLQAGDGVLVFTCLEDKPQTDLTVQLECHRAPGQGTAAAWYEDGDGVAY